MVRQEHVKNGYPGGRTSGGFKFLLNILHTIRTSLINTFFLKKKKKGKGAGETARLGSSKLALLSMGILADN